MDLSVLADGENDVHLSDLEFWGLYLNRMQLTARPQPKPEKEQAARAPAAPGKKRLSYLEAREWEQMEARILEAEQSLETLRAELQAASANPLELQPAYERMQSAEQSVEQLYARWAELEAKQQ